MKENPEKVHKGITRSEQKEGGKEEPFEAQVGKSRCCYTKEVRDAAVIPAHTKHPRNAIFAGLLGLGSCKFAGKFCCRSCLQGKEFTPLTPVACMGQTGMSLLQRLLLKLYFSDVFISLRLVYN